MLTLEKWHPKISRSSTSTLCTMRARQRPDGVDSCWGQTPLPWGYQHLSSPHSPSQPLTSLLVGFNPEADPTSIKVSVQ